MDQDGTFNVSRGSDIIIDNRAPAKPINRKKLLFVGIIIVALVIAIIVLSITRGKAPANEVRSAWNRLGNYIISGVDKNDALPQEMPEIETTFIYSKRDASYYQDLKKIISAIESTLERSTKDGYDGFVQFKDRVNALELSSSFTLPKPYDIDQVRSGKTTMDKALIHLITIPDDLKNDISEQLATSYYEYAKEYINYSIAADCDTDCDTEYIYALEKMNDAGGEYQHEISLQKKAILTTVYDGVAEADK